MTESERLAYEQQQQIANSRTSSSSLVSSLSADEANRRTISAAQNLDAMAANFVNSGSRNNNALDLNSLSMRLGDDASGNGGFTRVKQWEKQSKWESGEQNKFIFP
jgi:hypothetical protein